MSSIFERIKKNPGTIPIKAIRFLNRKVFPKFRREINDEILKGITLNATHLLQEPFFSSKDICKEADAILRAEYNLLGRRYNLEKMNWHTDFTSGKVWEKKHWTEMEYDLPEENADKKIPWELSKCQHFITLGLAYKQTKDKKYFEEYRKQFLSWIQENPYQIGINWVTPMECAIRTVNWIEAYHLFKEEYDDNLKSILIKQLYLHGKHIRENLEWSPAKENHYVSNLLGLFFIGTALENCKGAEKWKTFAQKELEKEILKQVSEDGVDYEASLNYHRLVTEIFLLTYMLAEKNNIQFSETYKKRLENMCEFIRYYTSPTGTAPSIGDTDNGRIVHIWNENINDHRDLLTVAAVLFQRPDFKAYGVFHDKLSLLISKADFDKLPSTNKELPSQAFTDYYIIRDSNLFILIHCGDIGRKGFGGHGHNDQLSFVLSTAKHDYIIDSGTYAYTSDRTTRHLLRGTAAHNTVVLNGEEQNKIKEESPFDMENNAKAMCFQWQTDKIQDVFIGKHFGYTPNIVTREIHYDRIKKQITIADRMKEEADLECSIHLHPEVKVRQEKNKVYLNDELMIEYDEEPTISKAMYSPQYGVKGETNKITIKKKSNALLTKIYFQTPAPKKPAAAKQEPRKVNVEEEFY